MSTSGSTKPAVRSGDDDALVGQQGAIVILFEVEHILVVITAKYCVVGQVCVWRTVINIIRMAGTDICAEIIIKAKLGNQLVVVIILHSEVNVNGTAGIPAREAGLKVHTATAVCYCNAPEPARLQRFTVVPCTKRRVEPVSVTASCRIAGINAFHITMPHFYFIA